MSLLRSIPTPAFIHQCGIIQAANRAAQNLFGFADEAAMVGFNIFSRLSEASLNAFEQRRQAEFALYPSGEDAFWEHFDLNTRDGSPLPAAIACSRIQHQGQTAVLSFIGNHTTSSALHYALRYSREVAVTVTDQRGLVTWANSANTELTGYSPEELFGKTPGQVLQCEGTDAQEVARLGRHIRAGSSVSAELLNRHKSGREYWARVEVLPSRSPDGELIGFVGLQTDVTTQMTRRRYKEVASDEALVTFSHEARAPLNAVLNLLDLLLEAPLSTEHAVWLRHAIDASNSLKDLVVNVLDTSRIEHLTTKVPLRPTRIQDVLRQIELLAEGYRRGNAVQLRLECSQNIPPVLVRSDLLLRTLLNLVSNALKYTPSGSVTVRVEHDTNASNETHQVMRFSVADTGIGIAVDDQVRIFKPFEVVSSLHSPGQESTGLGLNLCERMLSDMGTTLRLYSAPGWGTTVSFELGCATAQESAFREAQLSDMRLDGLKVLIVDDSPLNLMVIELQLQRRGAQVVCHEDVLLALDELFEVGPERFDVVLMDLQMPKLDGVDAVRRIRLRPGFDQLPVMALSGEVDSDSIEAALAAGMVDFVQKPFELSTLVTKLAAYKPA